MPIRNIIFDLGGVLLDIDYSKTISAFGALGLANPAEAFSKEQQSDLFKKLEKGLISPKQFYEQISEATGILDQKEIEKAWCALLGGFPQHKFDLLRQLCAEGYQMFILSNTNLIHQGRFESHIDYEFDWGKFSSLFTHIYYSHDLGMRKPDEEIFRFVIDKHKLVPRETLFIDDTLEHILGAKKLNLKVRHLQEGHNLETQIRLLLDPH